VDNKTLMSLSDSALEAAIRHSAIEEESAQDRAGHDATVVLGLLILAAGVVFGELLRLFPS
jgi:hypothetical protein